MSHIEQAVWKRTAEDATVAAMVTGVYPLFVPQDKDTPAVVYTVITKDHGHDLQGSSGLCRARIQLSVFGPRLEELETIVTAIIAVWQGYTGTVTPDGGDAVDILGVTTTQARFFEDATVDGSDSQDFHGTLDLMIWYRESIPSGI